MMSTATLILTRCVEIHANFVDTPTRDNNKERSRWHSLLVSSSSTLCIITCV
jgi:hypothetical protein